MSIYFNRGQVGKGGYSGQAPNNPRGSPSGDSKASEITSAEEQLFATTSAASESGMQAAIMSQPVDPIHVKRAVEEANELAQTQLKPHQSSIEFGVHKPSGRITITIREDLNGATIEREIPPKAFLKLYERLKEAREAPVDTPHRGSLIDVDG
ncbi:MAG: flagellar protein FlaG [Bradymonadia bacterium]